MNYKFPEIRTIDDVLPHIEGREEFIVGEREGYTVINYAVSMEDTFPPVKVAGGSARMREERSLTYRMRRECRGLIFYPDGRLMSRPFHKFFNVNEREETQMNKIDLSQSHVIMEKLDGSMIRPLVINGVLRLGTKMGVTDVAMNAEVWLAERGDNVKSWLWMCIENGVTPIFEWTSRKNQIVIDYDIDNLILTACRRNLTGEYFLPNADDGCPFDVVPVYGSVEGNLADYIARAREMEGREGDIIRFVDGHMLKIKNDWYVRIHKTMDNIRFDRHIVDLILNEELDDAVAMLPEKEHARVKDFERRFWTAFNDTERKLEALIKTANTVYQGDRKRVALEFVPKLERADSGQFIFGALVGKNLREMMLANVKKYLTSNARWDECAEWLGMN
jgi:RNA ligase